MYRCYIWYWKKSVCGNIFKNDCLLKKCQSYSYCMYKFCSTKKNYCCLNDVRKIRITTANPSILSLPHLIIINIIMYFSRTTTGLWLSAAYLKRKANFLENNLSCRISNFTWSIYTNFTLNTGEKKNLRNFTLSLH